MAGYKARLREDLDRWIAEGLVPAIQRLGALSRNRRNNHETAKSLIDRTAPALFVSAYQGQQ